MGARDGQTLTRLATNKSSGNTIAIPMPSIAITRRLPKLVDASMPANRYRKRARFIGRHASGTRAGNCSEAEPLICADCKIVAVRASSVQLTDISLFFLACVRLGQRFSQYRYREARWVSVESFMNRARNSAATVASAMVRPSFVKALSSAADITLIAVSDAVDQP
jgi:hypothetical protein